MPSGCVVYLVGMIILSEESWRVFLMIQWIPLYWSTSVREYFGPIKRRTRLSQVWLIHYRTFVCDEVDRLDGWPVYPVAPLSGITVLHGSNEIAYIWQRTTLPYFKPIWHCNSFLHFCLWESTEPHKIKRKVIDKLLRCGCPNISACGDLVTLHRVQNWYSAASIMHTS